MLHCVGVVFILGVCSFGSVIVKTNTVSYLSVECWFDPDLVFSGEC